ncbi:Chemotaxis response regulator protein-glutamate methylesterase CheB [hydrothermal vent metagenome]|uniref:Chemotaxis response regulator protein-glutamate methylesterase CheB n=1 Tax=hydrothermal vent metagenome TaxID=652676 RepID=A0A3B1BNL2_9ZZZZ
MTTRVLVVDDSGFFRRRVSEMLEADPLSRWLVWLRMAMKPSKKQLS